MSNFVGFAQVVWGLVAFALGEVLEMLVEAEGVDDVLETIRTFC